MLLKSLIIFFILLFFLFFEKYLNRVTIQYETGLQLALRKIKINIYTYVNINIKQKSIYVNIKDSTIKKHVKIYFFSDNLKACKQVISLKSLGISFQR